jgi:aminodeoxyfutalosine synthase
MLAKIRNKILTGKRLTEVEALNLYKGDDIFSLAYLASLMSEKKNGKKAYFVRNRHINPTNICVNRCRFCAFSRSKGQEGAYEMTVAEILKKLRAEKAKLKVPYSELHIVGGLHPDWPFTFYLELVSAIKKEFPKLHIKAFTAVEIDYFSKISGLSIEETLRTLKRCGLGSMPGGGAEIFEPAVRNKLCPEKISGKRWLEVMASAHKTGLRTNATMLYGHIESYEDRVDHLMKLRRLQDKTGGFQAFIPLAYHPKNTDIKGSYTSGLDDLKTIAISRLYLDNFDHIKAYWVMLGEKISQLALKFGADDIDGTIIEEKITRSAGGLTGGQLTADQLSDMIKKAGRIPVERDSFYRKVKRP